MDAPCQFFNKEAEAPKACSSGAPPFAPPKKTECSLETSSSPFGTRAGFLPKTDPLDRTISPAEDAAHEKASRVLTEPLESVGRYIRRMTARTGVSG